MTHQLKLNNCAGCMRKRSLLYRCPTYFENWVMMAFNFKENIWPKLLVFVILNDMLYWIENVPAFYFVSGFIEISRKIWNTCARLTLYAPRIVTNSINKPTRLTFCMYLFYNLFTTLHVSDDYFFQHQEFINLLYLQLCTNSAETLTCAPLNRHLLSFLYNHSLYTGNYRGRLKIAVVILLYKKEDNTSMTNYNSISLLTVFGQVFEKTTGSSLSHHQCTKNILVKE